MSKYVEKFNHLYKCSNCFFYSRKKNLVKNHVSNPSSRACQYDNNMYPDDVIYKEMRILKNEKAKVKNCILEALNEMNKAKFQAPEYLNILLLSIINYIHDINDVYELNRAFGAVIKKTNDDDAKRKQEAKINKEKEIKEYINTLNYIKE